MGKWRPSGFRLCSRFLPIREIFLATVTSSLLAGPCCIVPLWDVFGCAIVTVLYRLGCILSAENNVNHHSSREVAKTFVQGWSGLFLLVSNKISPCEASQSLIPPFPERSESEGQEDHKSIFIWTPQEWLMWLLMHKTITRLCLWNENNVFGLKLLALSCQCQCSGSAFVLKPKIKQNPCYYDERQGDAE